MHFTKMHGLGNDYLYVYSLEDPVNPGELSIKLSERHFGAGSDGMIWILPSDVADFRMRMFNNDGSEGAMCGNGIRCVGKYVYDKGYTDKTQITVETLSGIKSLDMTVVNGKVTQATVNMGKAVVSPALTIDADNQTITGTPVNVGNPHFVTFVDDISKIDLTKTGSAIEHHDAFPGGVNAEFVQLLDESSVRMRVWERGSGITMACGTGACATAAAAVANGYFKHEQEITVKLDGGDLKIRVMNDGTVFMTGPAAMVYEGETIDD